MNRRRLAVVISDPRPGPLVRSEVPRELAETLVLSLRSHGRTCDLVLAGDDRLREADVAIFVGDGSGLLDAVEELAGCRSRPTTVLWELHPLAPPGAGGRTPSRLTQRRQWYAPAKRAARALIPRSVRGRAGRTARRLAGPEGAMPAAWTRRVQCIRTMVDQGWLDHVVSSSQGRAAVLAEHGIRAHYIPVGYHPMMGTDAGGRRDIDVLLLDNQAFSRRVEIADRLREGLAERGLKLEVLDGAFGAERAQLLNRAKMSLILPRSPLEFPKTRLLLNSACGTLSVSEPSADTEPFAPGVHFVSTPVNEMPEVIARYVKDDDARQAMVDSASRLISTDLTMSESARAFLQLA